MPQQQQQPQDQLALVQSPPMAPRPPCFGGLFPPINADQQALQIGQHIFGASYTGPAPGLQPVAILAIDHGLWATS